MWGNAVGPNMYDARLAVHRAVYTSTNVYYYLIIFVAFFSSVMHEYLPGLLA